MVSATGGQQASVGAQGQSRQHQAGADGGTGCSPEKVSRVRHATVVLFRLLRSCFARSIDWVSCAKESSRIAQLDATEALGPQSLQDHAQHESHLLTQTQRGVKEYLQVLLGLLGIFRLCHDDLPDACRGPHLHSRVDRDGRLPALLIPGDATAGILDARVLGSRGGSSRSADVPERMYEPSTLGRHGDGGRRSHANLRRGERPGCREPGLARAPSGLLPDALGFGPCRRPSA
jgi:hypothetical protein